MHGDEIIGATTLTEFALKLCSDTFNKEDIWIKELLNKRLFVFTPFTNANGYYNKRRVKF